MKKKFSCVNRIFPFNLYENIKEILDSIPHTNSSNFESEARVLRLSAMDLSRFFRLAFFLFILVVSASSQVRSLPFICIKILVLKHFLMDLDLICQGLHSESGENALAKSTTTVPLDRRTKVNRFSITFNFRLGEVLTPFCF